MSNQMIMTLAVVVSLSSALSLNNVPVGILLGGTVGVLVWAGRVTFGQGAGE
jgi:hypothetical protein